MGLRLSAQLNTVFFIESLPENETKISRDLFSDIFRQLYLKHKGTNKEMNEPVFLQCEKRIDLLNYLSAICYKAKNEGVFPLIHFEIHGSEKMDGLVMKSGEFVEWADFFTSLKEINKACNNNLIVSMAVCHGTYILKEIDIYSRAPFFGLLSSFEKINNGSIAENFHDFFESLLTDMDLNTAVSKMTGEYSFTTSFELFERIYRTYERNFIDNPEAFNKRITDAVGSWLNDPIISRNISIPRLLMEARAFLVDSKPIYKDLIRKNFLFLNGPVEIDVHEQVKSILKKQWGLANSMILVPRWSLQ